MNRFHTKIFALALTVAAAGAFGGTAASAATFNNVSGLVCEGGVSPAGSSGCPGGLNIGDFNSNVADPTLNVVGDTHIYGGVAHRLQNQYQDNWTMNFGSMSYAGTFNWQAVSANFDGSLTVNGTVYDFTTPPASGSFGIGTLTGVVTFVLDATDGVFPNNPDEVATWDLELSKVPLPAAGWMLFAGLGGLAALRRRKKS